MSNLITFSYLISGILFILSLYGLSSPKTSRLGNRFGIIGMTLAIITTLFLPNINNISYILIAIIIGALIGFIVAKKIKMTSIPELIAAFHSLVGLAAVLIAYNSFKNPEYFNILEGSSIKTSSKIEIGIGSMIGAITFTGSIVAFLKLSSLMKSSFGKFINKTIFFICFTLMLISLFYFIYSGFESSFLVLTLISLLVGFIMIVPIGGADMPVIVSMLNSYSGWAASGIGFTLNNPLLIITGAIVGSSGAILSYIMCKAMNRSILNVMFGNFNAKISQNSSPINQGQINQANAEDCSFMIKNSSSVIIVPGYGMAVAGAQHAIKELVSSLEEKGIDVKFAIHPVAGRMPGHMNVLLAEANIDYDKIFELEDINGDFSKTDIVLVVGANDVTNPAAKTDKTSPIYGMPILEVSNAKSVFFIKRSMNPGYSGVENELFYKENTLMLFGDAKKVIEGIIKEL